MKTPGGSESPLAESSNPEYHPLEDPANRRPVTGTVRIRRELAPGRSAMKVAHYEQTPEQALPLDGAKELFVRLLIGPEDGAGGFTMLRLRVAPGGNTPLHSHAWEEEVFVVRGKGELITSSGGVHPLGEGDVVFARPQEEHQFKNTGQADLELLCVIPILTR